MTELKPCPFCGGHAQCNTDYDFGKFPSSIVICTNCQCSTKLYTIDHVFEELTRKEAGNKAKQQAIAAWNKRAKEKEE